MTEIQRIFQAIFVVRNKPWCASYQTCLIGCELVHFQEESSVQSLFTLLCFFMIALHYYFIKYVKVLSSLTVTLAQQIKFCFLWLYFSLYQSQFLLTSDQFMLYKIIFWNYNLSIPEPTLLEKSLHPWLRIVRKIIKKLFFNCHSLTCA
jgi:hypothetical protein